MIYCFLLISHTVKPRYELVGIKVLMTKAMSEVYIQWSGKFFQVKTLDIILNVLFLETICNTSCRRMSLALCLIRCVLDVWELRKCEDVPQSQYIQ
jgi:hypothetical protein